MTVAADRRREWIAAAALFLLAAMTRIATAEYGLWFDEIASTAFAHEPLQHLWSGWMVRENNPPLFYTILRGWIALVGDGDFALRLLPIAVGLCGVALAWSIARRLGGIGAGLLVVALLAVSTADVEVSQEVRGYILGYTGTLAATACAIVYLERPRPAALVGYALATLVALYSHTTMLGFAIVVNLAMVVLLRSDRRAVLHWLVANAAVAIGWAWWIGITLAQVDRVRHSFGWIAGSGPAAAWAATAQIYLPGYTLVPVGPLQAVLLAAAFGGVLFYVWRDRRPAVILLACLTFGAPLLLFALRQVMPFFMPRMLGWAGAPWTILIALAITRIPLRAVRLTLVGAILLIETIVLVRWIPFRAEEDWRGALQSIAAARPDAIVLVQGDAMAIAAEHYRARAAPATTIAILPRAPGTTDGWADGMAPGHHIDPPAAAALLQRTGSVYALRRGDSDPAGALRAAGIEQRLTNPPADRQPYVSLWRSRRQPGSAR